MLMDQHEGRHQPVVGTFVMNASLATSGRRFEMCNDASHERLPLSTAKTAHSLSTAFEGSRYDRKDQQKVLVKFEPSEETSCVATSDRKASQCYEDQGHDESGDYNCDQEGVVLYLILYGVSWLACFEENGKGSIGVDCGQC